MHPPRRFLYVILQKAAIAFLSIRLIMDNTLPITSWPTGCRISPQYHGFAWTWPFKRLSASTYCSFAKQNVYFFSPVHFREREIGYLVLENCDYLLDHQFLFETLNTFRTSIEALYGKLILRKKNKQLSQLYIHDSLTGLYNRMAYEKLALPLFQQYMQKGRPVGILFADADHLKYIQHRRIPHRNVPWNRTAGSNYAEAAGLDLELILASVNSRNKKAFLEKTLDKLSSEDLELLRIYFSCDMSLKKNCEETFLHKNTIQYRLNQIHKKSGYNPREFQDAVRLYLALKM